MIISGRQTIRQNEAGFYKFNRDMDHKNFGTFRLTYCKKLLLRIDQ